MIGLENTQYWMEHYLTYEIFPAVKPEYVEEVATFLVGVVNDVNAQISKTGGYISDKSYTLPECLQPKVHGVAIQTTMSAHDLFEWFGILRATFIVDGPEEFSGDPTDNFAPYLGDEE